MTPIKCDRGFIFVNHPAYLPPHEECRLVSESSAIGDYEDSYERPGTSFLWVGEKHHLNREEVRELRDVLTFWLRTGRLSLLPQAAN